MSKVKLLSFDVLGVPVPAPRPSVGRKGVYMDRRSEHWKSQIRDAAEDAMRVAGWKSMGVPLAVNVTFVMVRRGKAAEGRTAHAIRPDLDNLLKLVLDALTKAKVYKDDCVVSRARVAKRWQMPGERFAGVKVMVSEDRALHERRASEEE